ncbi:MAG TPA: SDR family oxidoreductase [Burkholderiaceae bacterium]|nr:SDR family oxidoreductase [Burkholderiaceae bacterium]
MNHFLKNRVAIVTGGHSRIGRLLARSLAAVGARVVVADCATRADGVEALPARGPNVELMDIDVTSASDVERMVGVCEQRFGRIDLLLNNATSQPALRDSSFSELTVDDWHQSMNVNVLAPFLCCRAVLPAMKRNGGGQVINIVSATGDSARRNPLHQQAGSGALLAMTRTLAHELREFDVSVNTVAVGYPQVGGLGIRFPEGQAPLDVLDAVAFLSAAGGRAFTGHTVNVERLIGEESTVRQREEKLMRRNARRIESGRRTLSA